MKLIECPRDAMQGIHEFIPTELKAAYLNLLLQVGFDTIDFGSFVSAKAVPQMRDTADVLAKLDLSDTNTKLLAIVANERGIREASSFEEITYLGFPFSVSETFQKRNTNSGITESISTVETLIETCSKYHKIPVVYLSMGFGNPYGDPWSPEITAHWAEELIKRGVKILSLADTVGLASPEDVRSLFSLLTKNFPSIEFGVHLHSTPINWHDKIDAAYQSGCQRFDSAVRGYGGCPMAGDELTGNIATENLISYFKDCGEPICMDVEKFQASIEYSALIFK